MKFLENKNYVVLNLYYLCYSSWFYKIKLFYMINYKYRIYKILFIYILINTLRGLQQLTQAQRIYNMQ